MFHPVPIEEVYRYNRNTNGYYTKLLKEFMQSEHICVKCDIPNRSKVITTYNSLYAAIKRHGLKDHVHIHRNADDIYLIKSDKA